jgi:GNAT superfamily N-acetyltransferase
MIVMAETFLPEGFSITTDKSRIDVPFVHRWLSEESYWCKGISLDIVQRAIDHSMCFAVLHHHQQVGFARVITDRATFAYLADVFVIETYRGRGLSKCLIQFITTHPELQGFRRFTLATLDAHGLYAQYGFVPFPHPERWMEIYKPDIYKESAAEKRN